MSRPTGSKNKEAPPKIIQANDTERLEYLAALLLEIIEADLQGSEVPCAQM